MTSTLRTFVFWIVIVIAAALLWQSVRSSPTHTQSPEVNYSTFISKAQCGEIARVNITGTRIDGEYRNGQGTFHVIGPSDPAAFLGVLQDKGVEIQFRDAPSENTPLRMLGTWAPLVLLAALWLFMVRQMRRKNPPGDPTGGVLDGSIGPR